MSGNTALCNDTSEAIELFKPQGLYLKPIARLNVSVQLPQLKQPGKTISNWEVMEKVKHMVKPHAFLSIKVVKSTLEFIRLEGEADNKVIIQNMIQRLEGKTIKLSGFPDTLKIKAAEAKVSFPSRHTWDSYFRDAKNMNEMKPGERPDTLHLKDLPTKWFSTRRSRELDEPSEQVLRRIFEGFGEVRCVDIPMLDPYRKEMTFGKKSIQTFTFGQQGLTFEAFVQYKEYIGFVKAMDALRGMKLLYIPEEEEGKAYASPIKVDFDKTKHLSDRSIKKRRIEREKLMQLEREREEKVRREREEEARKQEEERRKKEEEEQERERKRLDKIQKREERRREREMKRKEKREERKKQEEERCYQLKIEMEERRFLIAQRKLESIRLLSELFNRVRAIKIHDDLELREKELELEKQRQIELEKQRKEEEKQKKKEAKIKKKLELQKQEDELRNKILKNFRKREEQKEEEMREKLREKLAGTCKVKSAVIMKKKLKEVMNERNKSVDLYGYGTMSNWDQSIMDENYRQWAMAFYNYWYQRYATLGFYKPKAMGFYKPKGYSFHHRGEKGFKFNPRKYYKPGMGGYKPMTKGYFPSSSKGAFKHHSPGFTQKGKGFHKSWTKNYYEHDMREDYDDSQDYDDDRYEYSDYSDDSEYYEKSTKSKKRKMEKTKEETKAEKRKTKKAKIKKKELKPKFKKDHTGDTMSSEESDDNENESVSQEKKKKIVAKKRRSGDLDETAESSKGGDNVKVKKTAKKSKVREIDSENIDEKQKSKGVEKEVAKNEDQNSEAIRKSESTKSDRSMEIGQVKSKKAEITSKDDNESKERNVKTKIAKGRKIKAKSGKVVAAKKKRKTKIANESSKKFSVDSENKEGKIVVESTDGKSVEHDEDKTSKCEDESKPVDLYEGTGISVDLSKFKSANCEEEKKSSTVESRHVKSDNEETLNQEKDIFDGSINKEEEIEIS